MNPTDASRPIGASGSSARGRRGLVVVAVAVGLATLAWFMFAPIPVPVPPLEGADPAVVASIQAAETRVRDMPSSAETWGELGMVLLANKYDGEATTVFQQAEAIGKDDPRWPYLHGIALLNRSPLEAIPAFRRAVSASQGTRSQSVCRLRLAETLLANGEVDEAETQYREIVDAVWAPCVDFGLGSIAAGRGDWAQAKERWTRCLGSPWTARRAEVQLLGLFRRLKEPGDDALREEWTRRHAASPASVDAPWPDPFLEECLTRVAGKEGRVRRAQYLEQQGKIGPALDVWRSVVDDYPSASNLLAFGTLLGRIGQFDESEKVLKRCWTMDPRSAPASHYIGLAIFAQAEKLKANPNRSAESREKFESAARWSQKAIDVLPHYGEAYFQLGLTRWCLEDRVAAASAFRKAVDIRPDLTDAHLWLGKVLLETGNGDEALVHLRHAVRYAPPGDRRARQELERLQQKPPAVPKP